MTIQKSKYHNKYCYNKKRLQNWDAEYLANKSRRDIQRTEESKEKFLRMYPGQLGGAQSMNHTVCWAS